MSNSIAISGASGFLGKQIAKRLREEGATEIVGISRSEQPSVGAVQTWRTVADLNRPEDFQEALEGCEVLVHLADTADRGADGAPDPDAIAQAVGASQVSRVILASSIYARLHGAQPNSYGQRKLELEAAFERLENVSLTTLRLPPVYGHGCRGGFAVLAALIRKGLPIPLKNATAERDYISVENVSDLVAGLLNAPEPKKRLILEPSDGRPISTKDLALEIAAASDRPARLFFMPNAMLRFAGQLTGKSEQVRALLAPLRVTDSVDVVFQETGWRPQRQMPETLSFLRP